MSIISTPVYLLQHVAHIWRRSPTQPMDFISLLNSFFFPSLIFNTILLEFHFSTPSVISFTNYFHSSLSWLFLGAPKSTDWSQDLNDMLFREMHYLHPQKLHFKVKSKQKADKNRKGNLFLKESIVAILENIKVSTSHNISTTWILFYKVSDETMR